MTELADKSIAFQESRSVCFLFEHKKKKKTFSAKPNFGGKKKRFLGNFMATLVFKIEKNFK